MKAALFESPGRFGVVDRPLRSLREGEALVRVDMCGVCGTDLHIVEGTSRSTPPVVLGHEFAGVVEESTSASRTFKAGDRVAVDPNIACGTCFFCRRGEVHLCENLRALGVDIDGGMAQFCIVPADRLFRLPDAMAPEVAAFVEPLSCAVHGIDRARVRAGDTVVIIGGGTVGLLLTQLARHAGAARTIVIEPIAWKRKIASAIGADILLDPVTTEAISAVRDLTGVGADVVIECAGKGKTVSQALEMARRGGTVVFFGVCPLGETIPVEPNRVYFRELTIVGSYVNPHTFDRAIALLASGAVNVNALQATVYPMEHVHAAMDALREGSIIKALIRPS